MVLALFNTENNFSKLDWVDEDLEVIEYNNIDIIKLCPDCWIELENRIFDTDWKNLEEFSICTQCGYWKPFLK